MGAKRFTDNHVRFADEELNKFYTEFLLLESRIEAEREEFRKFMLENRKATEALTKSTSGLVEAWTAAQGAVKVTAIIGNVLKWGLGIGAGLTALYQLLKGSGKIG